MKAEDLRVGMIVKSRVDLTNGFRDHLLRLYTVLSWKPSRACRVKLQVISGGHQGFPVVQHDAGLLYIPEELAPQRTLK